MITNITPYLHFENCEEALNFYVKALGGEIKSLMRMSDGPQEYQTPENKNQVMHSELVIGKNIINASDAMGYDISAGKNISLTLHFDNVSDCEKAWANMKDGGVVTMELQEMFWAHRYGQLKDKYNINWMFNCAK